MSARAAATAVARTLRDAGHIAYFAGGCVRDELLGRAPDDYDIATDAPPARVVELFERTHTVGAAFAVVLVRLGGQKVEIATFRTDGSYTDSRRPDSVELSTPEEDAKRRDFTINAMFLDPFATGDHAGADRDPAAGVVDYVGGLADLRDGVIRAVGIPEQRLREDHLRALRAVRFAARFGFSLDDDTARAIRAHASDLNGVSRERIGDEVRRMLLAPSRARAIGLIEELGLGASVLGRAALDPAQVAAHPALGCAVPVPAIAPEVIPGTAPVQDPEADKNPFILGLAAWCVARDPEIAVRPHAASGLAGDLRSALMLSNTEHAGLRALLGAIAGFVGPNSGELLTDTGVEHPDGSGLGRARAKRQAAAPGAAGALSILDAWRPKLSANLRARIADLAADGIGLAPVPLITGDLLIAQSMRPGPMFGKLLHAVYDLQLVGDVPNQRGFDRDTLLAMAMELGASMGVQLG